MAKTPSIRKLVEKTNFAPHQSAVGVDTFPRLNLDAIAKQLALEEHGRLRGADVEPPADTADFDEIEDRILEYISGRRDEAVATYKQRFGDYLNGLHGLGLQTAVATIEGASKRGCANIEQLVDQFARSVATLSEKVDRAHDDLMTFKHEHKRTSEAVYPVGAGAWTLRVGVLVALLLVESLLNAVFLGEGSEYGFAGGWLEAIGISAINVAFGVGAGLVPFRLANHVQATPRALGRGLAIGWFVIFAIGFNLLAGHYRDALAIGGADAGSSALGAFLASPFGLATAQSWMLLALGIAFAAIAAFDGYKMSDPYPGYASKAQRLDQARSDRNIELDELMAGATARYSAAVEEMGEVAGGIAKKVVHSEQHKLSITNLHESFGHHLKYLESCAASLLTIYREANKAARPKGTIPRSFRRKPVLSTAPDLPALPAEYSTENLKRLGDEAESRRRRGEARLEAARRKARDIGQRIPAIGDGGNEGNGPDAVELRLVSNAG